MDFDFYEMWLHLVSGCSDLGITQGVAKENTSIKFQFSKEETTHLLASPAAKLSGSNRSMNGFDSDPDFYLSLLFYLIL